METQSETTPLLAKEEVKETPVPVKEIEKMMCRIKIDLNTLRLLKQENPKAYNIMSTFHTKLCSEEWTLKVELSFMNDPEAYGRIVQDLNDKSSYAVGEDNIKHRLEMIELTQNAPYLVSVEHWRYKGENAKQYSYDRPMVEWKQATPTDEPKDVFTDLEIAVESNEEVDETLDKVFVRAPIIINTTALAKMGPVYHGSGSMVPIGKKLVFFEITVFSDPTEGGFEKQVDGLYSSLWNDPVGDLKDAMEKEKDAIKKDNQQFSLDLWNFTGNKPYDFKKEPKRKDWTPRPTK